MDTKKEDILTKTTVIKASQAIQMSNVCTLLQRKTYNILLAEAYDKLLDQDIFEIPLSDVLKALNIKEGKSLASSRVMKDFKETIEKLNTVAVKWNILGKDKDGRWKTEAFGAIPLLAGTTVSIKDDKITYSYSPLIRRDLHKPKMYAKIILSLQNRFVSKHSLALYELSIDYLDENRGEGETPWITIAEYKELMGVGENKYLQFKRLNTRLIKEPVVEICKKSELDVVCDYKKEKRQIVALKFCIKRKNCCRKSLPFTTSENNEKFTNEKAFQIIEELIFYGISKNDSVKFMDTLGEKTIREGLEIFKEKLKANKINKNPSGYLRTLLAKGVRKSFYEEKNEKLDKKLEQERKELKSLERKEAEQSQREFYQEIDSVLQKKNTKEIEELVAMFEKSLPPIVRKFFASKGVESIQFKENYYCFLAEKFNITKPIDIDL